MLIRREAVDDDLTVLRGFNSWHIHILAQRPGLNHALKVLTLQLHLILVLLLFEDGLNLFVHTVDRL